MNDYEQFNQRGFMLCGVSLTGFRQPQACSLAGVCWWVSEHNFGNFHFNTKSAIPNTKSVVGQHLSFLFCVTRSMDMLCCDMVLVRSRALEHEHVLEKKEGLQKIRCEIGQASRKSDRGRLTGEAGVRINLQFEDACSIDSSSMR